MTSTLIRNYLSFKSGKTFGHTLVVYKCSIKWGDTVACRHQSGIDCVPFREVVHMFDGNPKVGARHWMLHKVFMVACHLNAMLTRFIYILIIPRACACVRAREWELPWWQPINSALGDSARRNSDSRAALVMQYGSTGIRELSYTLKVTLCVCVCVCACAHICCLPLLLSCHPSLTHGGPAWNSLMT